MENKYKRTLARIAAVISIIAVFTFGSVDRVYARGDEQEEHQGVIGQAEAEEFTREFEELANNNDDIAENAEKIYHKQITKDEVENIRSIHGEHHPYYKATQAAYAAQQQVLETHRQNPTLDHKTHEHLEAYKAAYKEHLEAVDKYGSGIRPLTKKEAAQEAYDQYHRALENHNKNPSSHTEKELSDATRDFANVTVGYRKEYEAYQEALSNNAKVLKDSKVTEQDRASAQEKLDKAEKKVKDLTQKIDISSKYDYEYKAFKTALDNRDKVSRDPKATKEDHARAQEKLDKAEKELNDISQRYDVSVNPSVHNYDYKKVAKQEIAEAEKKNNDVVAKLGVSANAPGAQNKAEYNNEYKAYKEALNNRDMVFRDPKATKEDHTRAQEKLDNAEKKVNDIAQSIDMSANTPSTQNVGIAKDITQAEQDLKNQKSAQQDGSWWPAATFSDTPEQTATKAKIAELKENLRKAEEAEKMHIGNLHREGEYNRASKAYTEALTNRDNIFKNPSSTDIERRVAEEKLDSAEKNLNTAAAKNDMSADTLGGQKINIIQAETDLNNKKTYLGYYAGYTKEQQAEIDKKEATLKDLRAELDRAQKADKMHIEKLHGEKKNAQYESAFQAHESAKNANDAVHKDPNATDKQRADAKENLLKAEKNLNTAAAKNDMSADTLGGQIEGIRNAITQEEGALIKLKGLTGNAFYSYTEEEQAAIDQAQQNIAGYNQEIKALEQGQSSRDQDLYRERLSNATPEQLKNEHSNLEKKSQELRDALENSQNTWYLTDARRQAAEAPLKKEIEAVNNRLNIIKQQIEGPSKITTDEHGNYIHVRRGINKNKVHKVPYDRNKTMEKPNFPEHDEEDDNKGSMTYSSQALSE